MAGNQQSTKLLLVYPNGIICIYDDILSNQSRRKVHLKEIIQSDYLNMISPKILNGRFVFVSYEKGQNKQVGPKQNQAAGANQESPLLVSIDIDKLESEIIQKRQVSTSDTQIMKMADQQPGDIKIDFNNVKLTDLNYSIILKDVLCFFSFSDGHILHFSFTDHVKMNQFYHFHNRYEQTPIFESAWAESKVDFQKAKNNCRVTCIDFLGGDQDHFSNERSMGLLLIGDGFGFVSILQLTKVHRNKDQLLYMSKMN